jgi:hypothetical protein
LIKNHILFCFKYWLVFHKYWLYNCHLSNILSICTLYPILRSCTVLVRFLYSSCKVTIAYFVSCFFNGISFNTHHTRNNSVSRMINNRDARSTPKYAKTNASNALLNHSGMSVRTFEKFNFLLDKNVQFCDHFLLTIRNKFFVGSLIPIDDGLGIQTLPKHCYF